MRKTGSSIPIRLWRFYSDGFRSMTVGKKLWTIIIIKLIILFAVFRLFFFPDVLNENYDNDYQKASAVRASLIDRSSADLSGKK